MRTVTAVAFEGQDGLAHVAEEGLFAEASDPLHAASRIAWYWNSLPGATC